MFHTKARGVWANFRFDCPACRQEATVTNARPDPHDCQPDRPLTLDDIQF